jgi:AcrR family transcriptional regulator
MRVSRVQAEENRERVINVASRLFREHGFDGIGLKDLMKGAGLTQGGFYKQFASKDDLAALASRRALESATRRWSDAAADTSDPLESIISFYSPKIIAARRRKDARLLLSAPTLRVKLPKFGARLRMVSGRISRCSKNSSERVTIELEAKRPWQYCP